MKCEICGEHFEFDEMNDTDDGVWICTPCLFWIPEKLEDEYREMIK